MRDSSDLYAFYIVTENDDLGESAHGPYTMTEAESLVQVDEKIVTRTHLVTLRENQSSTKPIDNTSPDYSKMLREIRSWGILLLILGAVQIFTAEFLSNTWGVLLVIVGLASFYFRSMAMFVIYGTTLGWAAISNALSGAASWGVFSLLQAFFAFQTFKQFSQFRSKINYSQNFKIAMNSEARIKPDKAAPPFPWISIVLGTVSIFGFVAVFLAAILFVGLAGSIGLPAFINFAEGMIVDFAVLGFSTGLASVLLKYQHKVVSIIGMITGGLVLILEVGLKFL